MQTLAIRSFSVFVKKATGKVNYKVPGNTLGHLPNSANITNLGVGPPVFSNTSCTNIFASKKPFFFPGPIMLKNRTNQTEQQEDNVSHLRSQ